jgi:hypothetical protein
MSVIKVESNFKFKGDRKYVHSSTICDFILKYWCAHHNVPESDISLTITFHNEIKHNGKIIFFDEKQSFKEIGSSFECAIIYKGKVKSYCYLKEEGSLPLIDGAPVYSISNLELTLPYSGTCSMSINSSLSLLENTIEANKKIHLMTAPDEKYSVLNMYMINFPFNILKKNKTQRLCIQNIRWRKQLEGIATINNLWFEEDPDNKFQISFYLRKIN